MPSNSSNLQSEGSRTHMQLKLNLRRHSGLGKRPITIILSFFASNDHKRIVNYYANINVIQPCISIPIQKNLYKIRSCIIIGRFAPKKRKKQISIAS